RLCRSSRCVCLAIDDAYHCVSGVAETPCRTTEAMTTTPVTASSSTPWGRPPVMTSSAYNREVSPLGPNQAMKARPRQLRFGARADTQCAAARRAKNPPGAGQGEDRGGARPKGRKHHPPKRKKEQNPRNRARPPPVSKKAAAERRVQPGARHARRERGQEAV